MQVRVLGPIDVVHDDGTTLPLRGPNAARLLALLVAGRPQMISVDDLAVEMWRSDEQPVDPVAALRTVVARVRAVLGQTAVATGTGAYALGEVETDAARFEDLVERARRSSGSPAAADIWRSALDLWRGAAFGGHESVDSVRREANRLDELRVEVHEAWFDARLAAGEGRELAADVEAAADEFPLREGFRAQLMTVLATAGRQAEALRAFQDFRGDLTEIGLEPSPRLLDLESKIATGVVPSTGARRTLRGYSLGDRIGEGAFATVHLATQASVGREVAVKQIRGQLADQPAFIRQFEAEAHLIARLEHPHVVPLYDYWREPGSAYLVMRYLPGGSLHGRIQDGAVPLEELVPMVGHVAAALDTAHRSGVIHRDVKPANILIDEEANAYLSDFGIAVGEAERIDPEAWLSNGSPAYAAPEQLRREEVGPSADIYALGVTTYEALTARLPFPGETTMVGLLERQLNDPIPLARASRPELPAAIDTVIQKATAKAPEDRYETASQFADDIAAAAGLSGDEALVEVEDRNPFKGLRAFDEADAADFSGRDRLVGQLVESVAAQRTVVVTGPSGSGKSSAVRAGLLPRLRQGAVAGSEKWFVTTMIPGAEPFVDLEAALLRIAVDPPADTGGMLRADSTGLARVLRRLVPENQQLVLIIDQFEELFTLTDESHRRLFLDAVVEAVAEERPRLRVVATLRADFYDQPLRHPGFAELVRDATVPVLPLAADELERAMTEPSRSVGASFEPGLVAEITADVADQPGALPLLQYTLTELYDRRVDEVLTRQSYAELGGVAGALGLRAEDVYQSCSTEQQAACRQVFGRLVNLGDGTEDTRRRVIRTELLDNAATAAALDALGAAGLLSFDRDTGSRQPTVEVAHEALLREWRRLADWLEEDREGLRIHRHLTEASTVWDDQGRPASELYRGGRLEAAAEWAHRSTTSLNQTEQAFLRESSAQQQAEVDSELRSNRRLRRLLAGVGVVAVLAVIAGLVAFEQRGQAVDNAAEAEDARQASETSRLGWQAAFQVEDNRQVGLLLAAEAARRDPGPSGLSALQRVLSSQDRYLGILGSGNEYLGAEWVSEDTVIGFGDDAIEVFDVGTGQVVERADAGVKAREFRHTDGHLTRWPLAAIGGDTLAFAETGESGLVVLELPSLEPVVEIPMDNIDGLAVAPDGSAIAVAFLDGRITVVERSGEDRFSIDAHRGDDVADQETEKGVPHFFDEAVRRTWPLAHFPTSLAFVDNGLELVSVRATETRFWDSNSGMPSRSLVTIRNNYLSSVEEFASLTIRAELPPNQSRIVSFSGSFYSVADLDGSIVGANQVAGANSTFGAPKVAQIVFRDDFTAWTLTDRGTLAIADMATGEIVGRPFETQAGQANDLRLSPDRTRFVVASETGIALVSATDDRLLARAVPRDGNDMAGVTSDGSTLALSPRSLDPDSAASTYDLGSGTSMTIPNPTRLVGFPSGYDPIPIYSFIAHDGGGLMSFSTGPTSDNAILTAWTNDRQERISFPVAGQIEGSAMSWQRNHYAYGDALTGELVVVDLSDGSRVALSALESTPRFLSFSVDDSRLALVDKSGGFSMLSTSDWSPIETLLDDLEILYVKFSPNGQWLATVEEDNLIRLRDSGSYNVVAELPAAAGNFEPGAIRFRGDLMELSIDGPPQLWDPLVGEPIGGPWASDPGLFGFFTGESVQIAVTGIGESFMLWNVDTDTWLDIACTAAGRNLTLEEWDQFGPADEPYRATCPQWPAPK